MKVNISKFDQLPDTALVSMATVAAIFGVGISTAWRYAATDPAFPKPVKLSKRCTRLRVGDVRAYRASKSGA